MELKSFTFNPFYENTYVLWDESGACAIVDPGCETASEQQELNHFIEKQNLKPVLLLQTHTHIDHVFGCAWVHHKYGLKPRMHKLELPIYQAIPDYAGSMGFPAPDLPEPGDWLDTSKGIEFGNTHLEILLTPGHSPGSVCFHHKESHQLIAGDVLFEQSIGRTDLPGGNYDDLVNSIRNKLFVLNPETYVFPGHGRPTQIGREKQWNPFFGDGVRLY